MTQTLNVEYEELIARAAEIERALPAIPTSNPKGPCPLSFVGDAATQLAMSSDSMRLYLKACEREWRTLAKSLRNAAKAYEEADEGSADSIDAVKFDGSGATSGGGDGQVSALCDPDEDFGGYLPPPPPPAPPFQFPYYEVRQAAKDIESGDQGTAFRAFASEWDKFQREFQKETYRFRPFTRWEGEARGLVEQNFELQRQWIYSMASLCVTLGAQALRVVDAHKRARVLGQHATGSATGYVNPAEHPTSYEVSQCDYWYKRYSTDYPEYLYMAIDWYQKLQVQSESSLGLYVSNASIPLQPVNPKAPPGATVINPPPKPQPKPDDDPVKPDVPDVPDIPDIPDIPVPSGETDVPTTPGVPSMPMAPSMPSAPTPQTPPNADAAVKNALKDVKGKGLPGGAGVKPAALGGGGGAGMPSAPLQPASDAGAATSPAAAGSGAGAAGRGMPNVAGAMGGGAGGGMAPMGGGQGQQDGSKGKRVQSEDESLYTEDRQWTEGVIGNRPRKAGPEK
jgi:ESX-1 secreted protein B PE domain